MVRENSFVRQPPPSYIYSAPNPAAAVPIRAAVSAMLVFTPGEDERRARQHLDADTGGG